jgi:hypothetical protein
MNLILRSQLDLIQMHFSACVSIDWMVGVDWMGNRRVVFVTPLGLDCLMDFSSPGQ